MHPLNFKEANRIMNKPVDWDEATMGPCAGLPVIYDADHFQITSLWGLTLKERLLALIGRPVVLTIIGLAQPPVSLGIAAKHIETSAVIPEFEVRVSGRPVDLSMLCIGDFFERRSGGKARAISILENADKTLTITGHDGSRHRYYSDGRAVSGLTTLDIIGFSA